jgi:hypothetical protein
VYELGQHYQFDNKHWLGIYCLTWLCWGQRGKWRSNTLPQYIHTHILKFLQTLRKKLYFRLGSNAIHNKRNKGLFWHQLIFLYLCLSVLIACRLSPNNPTTILSWNFHSLSGSLLKSPPPPHIPVYSDSLLLLSCPLLCLW